MAAVVPLAVLGCVLSLAVGYDTLAVVFACFVPVGVLGYRLVPRYSHLYESPPDVEPGSRRTLLGALFNLAVFCVAFATLGYFWVVFEWATVAALVGAPPAPPLAALGVLPGAFLGACVPVLAQRGVVFHRLQESSAGRAVGNLLTLGSFLALLDAAPAAVSGFVAAYVLSRLAVLAGWQVAAGD